MLVIFKKKFFCSEVGFTMTNLKQGQLGFKNNHNLYYCLHHVYCDISLWWKCIFPCVSIPISFFDIFLLPLGFHRAPLLECTLSIISIITCLLLSMGLIASGCFILVTFFTFSWLSNHQELIWVWINNGGKQRPNFFLISLCTNPTLLVMCLAMWMTHSIDA
jgi:hypothetical protein